MEMTLPVSVSALFAREKKELQDPNYMLILPLEGEIRLQGEQPRLLQSGTLVFLAPFSGYKLQLKAGSSVIYATLAGEFLETTLGIPKGLTAVLLRDGNDLAREKLIEYFDLCCNHEDADFLQKAEVCYSLLRAIAPAIVSAPADAMNTKDTGRASQFAAYLLQHFREPIQLQDLADAFGLTRDHMSVTLHKELGVPFFTYLQQLRLQEAQRLLLTTSKSITMISEESGFPNLRAMNTAFRRAYGVSPKEYRRQRTDALTRPDTALQANVLQNVNQLLQPYRMIYSKSEDAVAVSDVVPEADGTPYIPVWRDILNVDNSADCLQSTTQEAISEIQRELVFRYVRLGNIFCHELTPYITETRQHRYTYFFRVIEFFQKCNLIPMLVFGDSYQVLTNAVMVSSGAYSVAEADWLRQLETMLDASISRWGTEWVSAWRFEFHMPERIYGTEDHGAFLSLFDKSVQLIKKRLPSAEVGGPAIPMDGAHLARWNAWFKGIRTRNIPVDFVSMELWADYTMRASGFYGQFGTWEESRSVDSVQNADAAAALQKVRQIKDKMTQETLRAKLYISALGITKYQAAAAQIGGHCAAYLTKLLLELRKDVDGIGCWKAVNAEAEYADEYSIYGVGCGLLSRYGLKNPSWYAYEFLSELLPRLCHESLHCAVTGDGSGRYAVVLHNCKNYSDLFLRNYLAPRGEDFHDPKMYAGSAALEQKLTFPADASIYLVRQYLMGDHHGCIASVIRQMGEVSRLSDSEIDYISGQSLPYQHTFRINTQENLHLTVTLQPNEIMLLLISPVEDA